MVFLQGGADSWNFLVPYEDECDGGGGYKHYSNYRGIAALNKSLDELLPIDVEGQACAKYGLHHKMPFLRQMYEEKQLSFLRERRQSGPADDARNFLRQGGGVAYVHIRAQLRAARGAVAGPEQ